ncbi:MAG: fibronectin type III domain-containing protein [Treponema sp.]|jgi:hypothetical protein|nr:fibronectin type III domain-containing protein [Treponema sp.]
MLHETLVKTNTVKRKTVCKRIIAAVAVFGIAGGFFAACDMLQSGLSSELAKKLGEETGAVSTAGAMWYYPGAADMDMSLSPKAELALKLSKKAAVQIPEDPSQPNGLSGAFNVTYTNSAGKQSTAQLPFKGGHFNDDYTIFYLDASPIADVLNPGLNPTGRGILALTISGFVNNEDGDQKGRPLPPFTGTVDIAPLFPGRNIYFSTRYPVGGRSIEIPLNAPADLSETADFVITAGTNYPSGLYDANFTLGLSPDKQAILLTPGVELYDMEFDFSVRIMGIIPPMSSLAAECTFDVHVTNSLVIMDGVKDAVWDSPEAAYAADPVGDASSGGYIQPSNEIKGLYLLSDLNSLYVSFEFDSLTNFWEEDRLALLIDKAGVDTGDTTDSIANVTSIPRVSDTMTLENGESDVLFIHIPGRSRGKGNSVLRKRQVFVENDTIGSPAKVVLSQYGWVNPNGPKFLEYRFALADLGLAKGDTIRALGILSNYWDSDGSLHCTDIVPGGTHPDSRNGVYDFDTGLAFILGEGPAYTAPNPEDIIPPSAPTYLVVSEAGSNGVKLRWGTHFTAESYRIYRSDAEDGSYAALADDENRPQNFVGGSGADWSVMAGETYWYKVAGVNKGGEGSKTRAVSVTATGSEISKYSVIDMAGGALDDGFKPPLAASSTDSLTPGGTGNYDIKGLYVTNDADNLYIALDFGTAPPSGWDNCRITVMIDNTAVSTGSSTISINPASTTDFDPAATIEGFIAKVLKTTSWTLPSGSSTNAGNAWTKDGSTYLWSPSVNVLKIKVPFTSIGSPTVGTELRVFAAFSEGWDGGEIMVRDVIPVAATPGVQGEAQTLTINMDNALSHTVF